MTQAESPRHDSHPALVLTLLLLALPLTACISWADEDCRFTETRQASIDVDGADSLRVIARAGSLEIHGVPGVNRVEAGGQACASQESLLGDIRLETRRAGSEVIVEVMIPERESSGGSWKEMQRRLDLSIEVPASLAVRVEDSSGSIRAADLASLEIEDGSGSIDIADIAGSVRIRDGSGSIDLRRVGGDLWINDGSGSIKVTQVDGRVEVSDGSGSIEVRTVGQDMTVLSDGSGSILAEDVRGDFIVESDGSGSIRHRDIGGRVSVPERR